MQLNALQKHTLVRNGFDFMLSEKLVTDFYKTSSAVILFGIFIETRLLTLLLVTVICTVSP